MGASTVPAKVVVAMVIVVRLVVLVVLVTVVVIVILMVAMPTPSATAAAPFAAFGNFLVVEVLIKLHIAQAFVIEKHFLWLKFSSNCTQPKAIATEKLYPMRLSTDT